LATRRTASYPNISTKIVDLTDLSSFDDNTFDMITVCYGYMFCEDKQKACNESYRVLKPGGTLVATYWKNLHPIEFSKKVLAAVYRDGTVPPLSINPMSLSADGLCRDFLERAGFSSSRITTEVSEYPFDLGSNKDLVFKLGVLPAYPKLHELKERGDMVKELQRGEEVFWNEIAAAPNVDIDVNGRTIMYDNVFEMITAVK
jgi:SAM-dependent methyltransferase